MCSTLCFQRWQEVNMLTSHPLSLKESLTSRKKISRDKLNEQFNFGWFIQLAVKAFFLNPCHLLVQFWLLVFKTFQIPASIGLCTSFERCLGNFIKAQWFKILKVGKCITAYLNNDPARYKSEILIMQIDKGILSTMLSQNIQLDSRRSRSWSHPVHSETIWRKGNYQMPMSLCKIRDAHEMMVDGHSKSQIQWTASYLNNPSTYNYLVLSGKKIQTWYEAFVGKES